MICPFCQQTNTDEAEVCFTCGKALHALTQGAVLASRYVIREPLGRGGMGYVYRAFDRILEEDVAIKVIRAEFVREPEMAKRFRSEIRLARKVSHRNVCRIHEYGEDGGLCYLSMEFVEGVDLKRLLQDGPLPPARGLEVGIEAAEGLHAVHAHRIIHRDLKPSNIMVDRGGLVRLMDFGIAKEADSDARLTGSGLIGTPEYMSPEQAEGQKVGYASDVYALGCVLYEIFVGAPPFHAETPLNTLYMHLHDPPPLEGLERSLPEPLEPILRRALAKKPADRYGASELADALREARAALGTPTGAAAARRPLPPLTPPPPTTPEPVVTSNLGVDRSRGTASAGPHSRAWRWVLGSLAGLAAAIILANALRDIEAPKNLPYAAAPSTSPAASAPGPALPTPSPVAAATAPAPVRPQPARASPAARPSPGDAPSKRVDTVAATLARERAPSPSPASSALGLLSLVIVPPAEVTVDDASLGMVSIRDVPLAPGPHAVRVLHPDYKPLQRKVNIQAGLTERLVLDLTEKAIRRPASPRN